MASLDEIKRKVDNLQHRHSQLVQMKAERAGLLRAKREELAVIVQEIKAAGYDPKTLPQERDRAKADLEAMISKLDQEMTEIEAAFKAFDKK